MTLLSDGYAARLFEDSAFRKPLAAFSLPLLPLLAEVALTFIVCRGYLHKRPPAASIPTSIKSILLINVFLTVLLLCATLAVGMIVSAKLVFEQLNHSSTRRHFASLASLKPAATPISNWSVISESLQRNKHEFVKQEEGIGGLSLELLAMAMVWLVVLAYVGVLANIGFRLGCRGRDEKEKIAWSMKAMGGMMRVVDRSKWVGLYGAVVVSVSLWGSFHVVTRGWSFNRWDYALVEGRQGNEVVAVLLEIIKSERVWRWTAASSTLILLAVVSLYTITARLALYVCCKRFSLQHADAEAAEASISLA